MINEVVRDWSDYIDTKLSWVGNWLDENPTVNKVVVVVNHLIRMIAMAALMYVMPFSMAVNCVITLAASLFYRVTIERCCPFRFAIHSCIGGAAFLTGLPSINEVVTKAAFESLRTFGEAFMGLVPFGLYLGWVVYISSMSVDARTEAREKARLAVDEDLELGSCCK